MEALEIKNKEFTIGRIIYEFYPIIGGSVTHTLELSERIDPYLMKQTIFAPDFGKQCKEFDQKSLVKIYRIKNSLFSRDNISISQINFFIYFLNLYVKLRKMTPPDILHFHGIWSLSYGCIIGKLLGIPVVGMLHGSIGAYSKRCDLYETILAKVFRPDHAFVLDDGSEAPSKFTKIWGDKTTIVYHGVDNNYLKPHKKDINLIKKNGLKESDFIILSTSSLIPVKNIDLSIKSFNIFIKNNNVENAYLLIAGEGYLKESLIRLVENLGIEKHVIFLGGVSKNLIIDYLSICDLFVATSLYSNMNRATLEAMACQKPVIVFDNGIINKLIKHMENGILVKSNDVDSFAKHLYLLYTNPNLRTNLGIKARKTIIEERSWEKRIQKELEVYKILLKDSKKSSNCILKSMF